MSAVLEVRGLSIRYPGKRRGSYVEAVRELEFTIENGSCFGLVGPSGCGKSSAAFAVATLLRPHAGQLILHPKDEAPIDLAAARGETLRRARRHLALVFQDPRGALDPRWTIGASIAEPLRLQGSRSRRERDETVKALLTEVGLDPSLAARHPHELSGGQRQRVVIARALAPEPALIVLDEPTSALDVSIQAQVVALLADLQRKRGVSYLFISHDLGVVRALADRIGVMDAGQLVENRPCDALFQSPEHPRTKELLDAVLTLDE